MAPPATGHHESFQTVLITGVSQGMGRAMSLELAKRGHTVIGIARSEVKLAALRKECPRPIGQQHLFLAVDVTSDAAVKELASQIMEAGLVPTIVVNNAGVINKKDRIWEVPVEEVNFVLDVNIKGPINMLRHFLPILIKRGQGVVVNMSSTWGRTVAPDVVPYCTSKWAIEGLSRAVAMEVPLGVAVVVLDPGVINTDMLVSWLGDRSIEFPTAEEWAPAAVDMILNFTKDDNGSSATVTMDEKATQVVGSIVEEYKRTKKL